MSTPKFKKTIELLSLEGDIFIYEAYRSILNREPDPKGLAYYSKCLEYGTLKIEILKNLRHSLEGKQTKSSLVDLDKELQRYRRTKWPIIGRIFKENQKNKEKTINQNIQNKLSEIEKHLKILSRGKESYENDSLFNDIDNEVLEQLPPHARGIYRKLKIAIMQR